MFRVFGIQLAVHASFLLLLAYVGYEGWVEGSLPGLLWSVGLIILFFVCVILHELGHSLTARRYGVRVPRILLLPIGGMAEFDRIPRKPSEELLITVAGPAVNFVLAALLFALIWGGLINVKGAPTYSFASLLDTLWLWNLIMGIFNLLPVFPMDGGRILRALLALKLPYLRATWWAVMVTRILAPVFAYIAFFRLEHAEMLGALFIFIFFVCNAEYRQTLRRDQEERYWAELARQLPATGPAPSANEPPLLRHGPN